MASQNKKKSNMKKSGLNMRITLIMFALIPLLVSSIIVGVVSIEKSQKEIKNYTHDSLVQVIEGIGNSFDTITTMNADVLRAYATAPVLKESLLDPQNPEKAAKVEQFTKDYFGQLDGWEGLYLCDWNSVVVTHCPNQALAGKPLREGDALAALQNSMLSASNGVFNTGIMVSPASGQNIMSIYTPIYVDGQPIGYAGGAFYVQNIAEKISDVSDLNLSSAYTYFVDKTGIMLYHPDPEKVGNPVENAAVKGLVADIEAGKKPEPDIVEYEYKGTTKYAGYYIGNDSHYIAVLTADEDDVLSGVSDIRKNTILICVICVVIIAGLAIFIERFISGPLVEISKSLDELSTGDVTADCKAQSHIFETISIIRSFKALRDALATSMSSVQKAAVDLNQSIISVDGKTGDNVDSISQINTAINEVAETSQSVAQDAQIMAEKAADLGINIEHLNENVNNLHDASQTIKNANDDATVCMKSVYEGANESVAAMKEITGEINETNSAIADIGRAIQAIESIAA
ncbi:MAG: methyl-accepting chemotaxis protein, partial [Lachnospiraceae bacterium]|nr:methyl-accepting chemotaxis protein [Lachnospiraceae bacterium]